MTKHERNDKERRRLVVEYERRANEIMSRSIIRAHGWREDLAAEIALAFHCSPRTVRRAIAKHRRPVSPSDNMTPEP